MDQVFIIKLVGLAVSVLAFAFTTLSNMKDWFNVPTGLRSPVFSLWHVCFDGNFQECTDPITEGQYGYNPAVYTARILFLLAAVFLAMVVIIMVAIILDSPKVLDSALVLPILAVLSFLCLLIACPVVEGVMRLSVTRFLTVSGQPRVDSEFGWAGICAWIAFGLNLVNIGAMGAVFAKSGAEKDSDI